MDNTSAVKTASRIKLIASVIFLSLYLVLVISGVHRGLRVTGRYSETGLTFEPELIDENESLLFSRSNPVYCGTIKSGFTDYECFVVDTIPNIRYAAVKKDSDEYEKFISGKEVTGYFSKKFSDEFSELAHDKECSELGIIIVDRQKELLSFLWGIPFLIIGLILLKKWR